MNGENLKSVLVLEHIVFEKILFERLGFKTDNVLEQKLNVKIGKLDSDNERYKVNLELNGNKEGEYKFCINLAGFFFIDKSNKLDEEVKKNMVQKNTVAILMPYLRSEVSLLTSQPETECVVMPVLNINTMLTE